MSQRNRNLLLEPQDETLAMLQQALEAGLQAQAASVDKRILQANQDAGSLQTLAASQTLVNAQNDTPLGILPAGGTILTQKGARVVKKPDGTLDVFAEKKETPAPSAPISAITPERVVRANIDRAAGITPRLTGRSIMDNLKGLKGEDLLEGVSGALLNIGMEVSRHRSRIRAQAEQQSGYKDAQALLQQNIELDLTSPFAKVQQQGSYQTAQAQDRANAALNASALLARQLEESDPYLQELQLTARLLEKMEARKAQTEMVQEDRKERKAEEERVKLSVVSPNMVANLKLLEGDKDDTQARREILARATKDKDFAKVLEASPENIYDLLVDLSPKVRSGAFKILLESNKIMAGLDATPQDYMGLRKYIETPSKLLTDPESPLGVEEKKRLQSLTTLSASSAEKAAERQAAFANALRAVVQQRLATSIPANMTRWRSGLTAPNSELGKVISQVASTNKDGAAPLEDVIMTYLSDPALRQLSDMKKTREEYDRRENLLVQAISETLDTAPRSYLVTDLTNLKLQLIERTKNTAKRQYIRLLRDAGMFPSMTKM